MQRKVLIVTLAVIGALFGVGALVGGNLLANTFATHSPDVPARVMYQGFLADASGNPISATLPLTFNIYDAGTGGSLKWGPETHATVQVAGGYFSVKLGSVNPGGLPPSVFSGTPRYVEVTVNGNTLPRQEFVTVPFAAKSYYATETISSTYAVNAKYAMTATYAMNAPSGGSGSVDWQYVKVVAKSGGDYTTINDALNNISPSSSDRYLILVMPGRYAERVVLPEYVHLKGAGYGVTEVYSDTRDGNFNQEIAATMVVPANSQVSHLTVRNTSTTDDGVALRLQNPNEYTSVSYVKAETKESGGGEHIAVYLTGAGEPKLTHVYATVSGGTSQNWGMFNNATSPRVVDSKIVASGPPSAGIRLVGGDPVFEGTTIDGRNSSTTGFGVDSSSSGDSRFDRSTIYGDTGSGAAFRGANPNKFYVGASLVEGDIQLAGGSDIICVYTYDSSYLILDANCQ